MGIFNHMRSVCPHRVGDILVTLNGTDPSVSWPGTSWEEISGKYLRAQDDAHAAGSEFGSDTHTHGAGRLYACFGITGATKFQRTFKGGFTATQYFNTTSQGAPASPATNDGTEVLGTTAEESTLPVSLAVYMWKRVA